jgi:surface protein
MGCGGHQYGYPTSIKSYYESINILSVMKVQYDELVAGGLVPVATPLPPPNPIPNANWVAFVAECLDEAPVTGECTTWASGNNYGTMLNWDTSLVEDMSGYDGGYQGFGTKSTFNGDISNWNTSQVTNMHAMFFSASAFNHDIGSWNTAQVTDMNICF